MAYGRRRFWRADGLLLLRLLLLLLLLLLKKGRVDKLW
jgi:hypothetical protein